MKQIGHSMASLYKKASTRRPLTSGSTGRCISRGTISFGEGLLDVRDAMVFDLGLMSEDVCVFSLDDRILAMFADASEAVESLRPCIGTVNEPEPAVDADGRLVVGLSPGSGASTSGGI